MSTKQATSDWVVPHPDHVETLRSDQFKNESFLVEYVSSKEGCSCLAKTESILGVYLGRAIALMIKAPTRYHVKQYAIIQR